MLTDNVTKANACGVNDTACATVAKTTLNSSLASTTAMTTLATTTSNFSLATTIATTLKPISTISPAPTIPIEIELTTKFSTDTCTCDLQRQFCDINCCCDNDCSYQDKLVFRSCKREPNLHRDTSFCQYMDYIYVNNTPYKWEVNQNGLFCIAKSNLPDRYVVQKKEPITTLEDANRQKRNKHAWSDVGVLAYEHGFNMSENFVFGSNIWLIRNKSLELFELPDSYVTSACLMKRTMKFLRSYKTECSQTWISQENPNLSAETFFKNISVVRAPRYFNMSLFGKNFWACPGNSCRPIEVKICDENYINCVNVSGTNNRILCNDIVCMNALERVNYNLYHNGTRGFTKIELLLVLKNISRSQREFRQYFEVNYVWANYTFSYSSLLSGNPGYLIGKPILIATLNATTKRIKRNPVDFIDNFLVLPASRKGVCVLSNRTNVALEFGYNMIAKCRIEKQVNLRKNVTARNLCVELQKIIFFHWPFLNDRVIGSFGNANESVVMDWIKIVLDQSSIQILNLIVGNFSRSGVMCRNIVTDLKIDLFHSRVDYRNLHSQEKIIGATVRLGDGKAYEFPIKDWLDFKVIIREEVMFFDVTTKRVERYVDPPTFRISLPYDFFYPFVKLGNTGNDLSTSWICFGLVATYLIFMHS